MSPIPNVGYYLLISPGPLILARLPLHGKRGRRKFAVRWREIVKAAGAIMREHGLLKKQLWSIEAHVTADEWDPDPDDVYPSKLPLAERLAKARAAAGQADAAFAGQLDVLPKFHLYEWREGAFVLVRRPTA